MDKKLSVSMERNTKSKESFITPNESKGTIFLCSLFKRMCEVKRLFDQFNFSVLYQTNVWSAVSTGQIKALSFTMPVLIYLHKKAKWEATFDNLVICVNVG